MLMGIPSMSVDWTINAGTLLQAMIFVGSIIALYFAMKADIRLLKHDMTSIKQRQETLSDAFTQLGTILTQVAVQDTRINRIEADIKELRHGEGFVMPFDKSRRD